MRSRSATPARRTPRPPRALRARQRSLAYAALRPVVRLLLAAGLDVAELRAILDRALREHGRERGRGRWAPTASDDRALLGAAASVVSAWQQDPRWADERGEPRALRLSARSTRARDSFSALVRQAAPKADPAAIAELLLSTRTVVRRRGTPPRLQLRDRAVLYAQPGSFDGPALLTHLRRFNETLEHNVLERTSEDGRRLERAAHAFDLPAEAFADFERYLMQQAEGLISAADAKLRSYQRVRPMRSGARQAFGFGIYLFRDSIVKPLPRRTPARR